MFAPEPVLAQLLAAAQQFFPRPVELGQTLIPIVLKVYEEKSYREISQITGHKVIYMMILLCRQNTGGQFVPVSFIG